MGRPRKEDLRPSAAQPDFSPKKTQGKNTKPRISTKPVDERLYQCSVCGVEYTNQAKNFPVSYSPFYKGNNGRLNVCWTCFETAFHQYYTILGSVYDAIKRMCMHFDYYFDEGVADRIRNNTESGPVIGTYIRNLCLTVNYGKNYDDYLAEHPADGITSEIAMKIAQEEGSQFTEKDVERWGYGFQEDDYKFLNSELADWKSRCVVSGKSQETIVQELCVLSLQKHKRLIAEDHDGYRKYVDLYTKALKEANLSPRQEEAADKLQEIPLGKMIERFEKEEPIPEPRPEWRDVDGIMHVVLVYFLGHLCKMLGLKNRYAASYEEEMAKWTVTVDELHGADSETVYDYLLDHNFEDVTLTDGDGDG